MRERSVKTASCKNKARILQQLFRDALLAAFPHLRDGDVRSTAMGQPGVDIQLSPLARASVPYDIEAKSRATIAVYKWLEQRGAGKFPPLVVAKANRKKPICIMFADDFVALLQRAAEKP